MPPTVDHHVARLRAQLLQPGDLDFAGLVERIRGALETIAQRAEQGGPYVRGAVPDPSWLDAWEQLSDAPREPAEVLDAAMQAFDGVIRWHEPAAMHNINPPVLHGAVAATTVAATLNPNALWDLVSGTVVQMEDQLARQVGRLVGWNDGAGVTTSGGKSGLVYAIRLGLGRALPGYARDGLAAAQASPVVLTTEENHYTVRYAASLLGLGTSAVIDVPTDRDGGMQVHALESELEAAARNGRPVAAVVLSGGNTLDNVVDDVSSIMDVVDAKSAPGGPLPRRPFVHLDTPVGWPWLTFLSYDRKTNRLGIDADVLETIGATADRLAGAGRVDSFSIDLHKNGMCPYPGSIFSCRDADELWSVNRPSVEPHPRLPWGENFRQHHTLEHSRPAGPIIAAWTMFHSLGLDGIRSYVAHQLEVASDIRAALPGAGFDVANPRSRGFAVMCVPSVPGLGHDWRTRISERDRTVVQRGNELVYGLFRRLTRLDGSAGPAVVTGFVPDYGTSESGEGVAALRIYPMSPFLDSKGVDDVVGSLGALREEYLREVDLGGSAPGDVRLAHVPR